MNAVVQSEERRRLRLIVPPGQARERIDTYLAHQVQDVTRTKIQQYIEMDMVLVNGKVVKPSYEVQPNDVIDVTLPRPPKIDAKPENIPLDIVYEDDALLIVNKPAGMVTHPAYGNYTGTLVNALLHHCDRLSTTTNPLRPGIVHRLDKDTTGLLVVAKTDAAHAFLAKQFAEHTLEREYWAIVWGTFGAESGTVEANLGRSKKDRKKVSVMADGKHAVTAFEVIRRFERLTLLRLRLKTGRTHQIRVHLAHIGHPVFGDPTYGGRNHSWGGMSGRLSIHYANLLKIIPRQALHAKTIGFVHPTSRESVRFDSELPEDMKAVLEQLTAAMKPD